MSLTTENTVPSSDRDCVAARKPYSCFHYEPWEYDSIVC